LATISNTLPHDESQNVRNIKARDPVRFKAIAMSMRTQDKCTRSTVTRAQCKKYIEELVSETKVARTDTVMLLNQRHYVAWYE